MTTGPQDEGSVKLKGGEVGRKEKHQDTDGPNHNQTAG